MRVAEEEWQKIIQEMSSRFKSAGASRQTVSQVWNKEGVFMLGNMWEYKDEKAFIACQTLFREAEKKLDERTSIVVKKLCDQRNHTPRCFFLKNHISYSCNCHERQLKWLPAISPNLCNSTYIIGT